LDQHRIDRLFIFKITRAGSPARAFSASRRKRALNASRNPFGAINK
jgi:hypothetical protein